MKQTYVITIITDPKEGLERLQLAGELSALIYEFILGKTNKVLVTVEKT